MTASDLAGTFSTPTGRRLLVLACSATKRRDVQLLPALDRYAGPSFRVLRRWLREHPARASKLDVYVLSAAFGLFPAVQPIPNYDCRMTAARAEELRPQVHATLRTLLELRSYAAIGVSAGRLYRLALVGSDALLHPAPTVLAPAGAGIGAQLAALKQWLEA
jgi:hypothetical protein